MRQGSIFFRWGQVGWKGMYFLSGELLRSLFFFFFCLEVSHISNRDLAKRSASMEIRGQSFAVILIYIEELENSRY